MNSLGNDCPRLPGPRRSLLSECCTVVQEPASHVQAAAARTMSDFAAHVAKTEKEPGGWKELNTDPSVGVVRPA